MRARFWKIIGLLVSKSILKTDLWEEKSFGREGFLKQRIMMFSYTNIFVDVAKLIVVLSYLKLKTKFVDKKIVAINTY